MSAYSFEVHASTAADLKQVSHCGTYTTIIASSSLFLTFTPSVSAVSRTILTNRMISSSGSDELEGPTTIGQSSIRVARKLIIVFLYRRSLKPMHDHMPIFPVLIRYFLVPLQ